MKLSATTKKIIWVICILSLVAILASVIVCFIFYQPLDFWPFALGALLGAGLSIFKIIMLDRTVTKNLSKGDSFTQGPIYLQYFLRFVLTGLVLLLAALSPYTSMLWGTAVGIFTLPIAAFSMKFFPHVD